MFTDPNVSTALLFNTAFHNALAEAIEKECIPVKVIAPDELEDTLVQVNMEIYRKKGFVVCGEMIRPYMDIVSKSIGWDMTYDSRFSDKIIVCVPNNRTHSTPIKAFTLTNPKQN